MGYFSLDIKKAKGTSDTTQSDHIERKIIPKNADPTRTHLNRVLVEYPDGVHGRDEAIAHRLNTAGIKRKITHDQVRVVRVVLSGTHEDMMDIQENGRLDEWCSDSIQWLQATFGKDNVVAAHLHMDEKTPHIHAAVVPIVIGERRKAKKEQTDGKRKYRKKTNSVRLCADDLFNRQTLVAYHDNYARVMAKYGLQRGVRGSEARHTTTMQYYRDLKKKNEVLETETRLLQEKKAEAQEELKQVKAEIRTDKLKNAATDTATALASSVGSLFGSGKSCRFRYHFIETDPLFTIFLRYFESDGFLLRISSYYSPKVRIKQRDADYFIIGHYRSQTQFFSGNVNASTSQYICREPSYRSCHISNVTGIPQVLSPCPAFTQMY